MLSKSKQRIAIITIVILVFVLNSMLTSSKDKNTNKLNNTSTSTKEISQPTVVDDTKLSDDIISIEPEESKEQLLTEQNITQVQTQPSVTPALTVTAAPNSREELLIKEIEKQENLRVFRMSEKILSAKDGVIYTVPGKDEYQKLVDSIDRKTGLPTYKIEYNVYSKETGEIDNSQKISKTIKFNHEGKDVELNVSYVEKGNTMVFLPESNKEGFGIYSIRNSDLAILEYKGDLLFVDVDKNIVTPALTPVQFPLDG
jgi:hypothetical protein